MIAATIFFQFGQQSLTTILKYIIIDNTLSKYEATKVYYEEIVTVNLVVVHLY